MFRKLALAFVAAASLGALALTPSAASAKGGGGGGGGWHGGHHHHFHGGPVFGIGYVAAEPACYVTRRVMTPWGYHWRRINICY